MGLPSQGLRAGVAFVVVCLAYTTVWGEVAHPRPTHAGDALVRRGATGAAAPAGGVGLERQTTTPLPSPPSPPPSPLAEQQDGALPALYAGLLSDRLRTTAENVTSASSPPRPPPPPP
eukprot:Rhum_TRINITY_DN14721_c9_g1::Rhum_TRINITY_DN14721_c9_g1_i1::g.112685::m.112685